jgi:hypothetical protein
LPPSDNPQSGIEEGSRPLTWEAYPFEWVAIDGLPEKSKDVTCIPPTGFVPDPNSMQTEEERENAKAVAMAGDPRFIVFYSEGI